jgi:geranylgeranyl pyrophosphate synthase/predicted secreted hydrolase
MKETFASVPSVPSAQHNTRSGAEPVPRPADWPGPGRIDLQVHDLPHASATTEWWYVNCQLTTADERRFALFASFFRVVKGRDETTKELLHAHSATWALVDLDARKFYQESLVDRDAPRLGLEKLNRGEGIRDPRLRRALREILERGNVPYPDRMFTGDVFVHQRKLELDYDGLRFWKNDDGSYGLKCWHEYFKCGAELRFDPRKDAVRHGHDGVVRGVDGGDMFYYFLPRCDVTGTVSVNATPTPVASGQGWYDHEFGGQQAARDEGVAQLDVAWNWCAIQLDDGTEISVYTMTDLDTGEAIDQRAVVIDAAGAREEHVEIDFVPLDEWRSTRTFNTYPTRWRLDVPGAGVALTLTAAFEDQEFVTLISKPAFWEGQVTAGGTVGGQPLGGCGWVERSGYLDNTDLDSFFRAVGRETRKSVAALMPLEPNYEKTRDLIASEENDHYMEGVDLKQFIRIGVKPVREITDRGGKSWRSYAALACCDVVGGDSREFVQWLAMPELMHVGSLIVDDVQDRSTIRRGGPTCHLIYGDALAINAGTAAYFMGHKLLRGSNVSDAAKLELYDNYFQALRAGHAGQAADIEGLDTYMPECVETGDNARVERAVVATHRLKTAAPAAALSRMGAIAGGGTREQIDGLGRYFESLGTAFQIIDDVLNLRGFKGSLKQRGEDISHGKVTLPVAKAMGRLERPDREWVWETIKSRPQDQAVVDQVIDKLEACGAITACEQQARQLVDQAWARLQPLIRDSIVSLMLRSFGWYVLERHY